MIRILALSAINNGVCRIRFTGSLGRDIESMITSLQTIGVKILQQIDQQEVTITVHGVGKKGFSAESVTVDCGNSGTALRILMGLISSMENNITITGDNSLSSRDNESMINSLLEANVSVTKVGEKNLPLEIRGPWFDGNEVDELVRLDCSKSSQPLTSWMIASSLFPCNVDLKVSGPLVSNRHYQLTKSLCNKYGATIVKSDDGYKLNKWEASLPNEIIIPSDSSMASFAILLTKVHSCKIAISNWPSNSDCLGNEILFESSNNLGISWRNNIILNIDGGVFSSYDLTNCSDLITPLAAVIALGEGGEITGISHTVYKESNRINRTLELLDNFGLRSIFDGKRLIIEGGQKLVKPSLPVNCHDDHRLFMTAAILMTKFGGDLIGKGLHCVADVDFLTRLGIH